MSPDYAKPFAGALWCDVLPRSAVRPELSQRLLLHAGPPFLGELPVPVIHGAVQALVFEGLAKDASAAHKLIERGDVEFAPAQDHGIVTPLAQVVSASMGLVVVRQHGEQGYAPLIEGSAPALRFGSLDSGCLLRLGEISVWSHRQLAPLLRVRPVQIDKIIAAALGEGDECHARTAVAHAVLMGELKDLDPACALPLGANPAFVLSILMAAAAAAMRTHPGEVAAIGGNGIDFGLRRRHESEWRRVSAQSPLGTRFANRDAALALGAIGDSAVIDWCGLGGQALAAAPQLLDDWRAYLPADAADRRELVDPKTGIVDAKRVASTGVGPLINLAIIARDGAGLLGRGFYSPPASLF